MHPSAKHDCIGWTLDITCPPTFENYSSVLYNVRETIIRIIINLVCENTMSILDNKHKMKCKEVQTHCSILNGFLIWQPTKIDTLWPKETPVKTGFSAGANKTLLFLEQEPSNVTPMYLFLIRHQTDKLCLINGYYTNVTTQSHSLITRRR